VSTIGLLSMRMHAPAPATDSNESGANDDAKTNTAMRMA
jgi:hypothetical protein